MGKLLTRKERRANLKEAARLANLSNAEKKRRPFRAVVLGDQLIVVPNSRELPEN